MGKTSGSKQLASAASDTFATETKPLTPVRPCQKGKTLLKARLVRLDKDEVIPNATVVADKGGASLSQVSAAGTGIADFGVVAPGMYTFSVTLSPDLSKKFKPFEPKNANVPVQVDFQATLKLKPLSKLRIIMFDQAGKAIKDASWKMIQPVAASGTTGAAGLIEVDVPWSSPSGDLLVTFPDPPDKEGAPTPPAAADPANPAYPIALNAEHFVPKKEPANVPLKEVTWKYDIALIDEADDEDGWKARLINLGFPCIDAARTTRSVKAFQRIQKKEYDGSGTLADIAGDLKTVHDKV